MKDVAGNTLDLGDTVAITQTGYRNMMLGVISKFTPKGMKVTYTETYSGQSRASETFRTGGMVCLVRKGHPIGN